MRCLVAVCYKCGYGSGYKSAKGVCDANRSPRHAWRGCCVLKTLALPWLVDAYLIAHTPCTVVSTFPSTFIGTGVVREIHVVQVRQSGEAPTFGFTKVFPVSRIRTSDLRFRKLFGRERGALCSFWAPLAWQSLAKRVPAGPLRSHNRSYSASDLDPHPPAGAASPLTFCSSSWSRASSASLVRCCFCISLSSNGASTW